MKNSKSKNFFCLFRKTRSFNNIYMNNSRFVSKVNKKLHIVNETIFSKNDFRNPISEKKTFHSTIIRNSEFDSRFFVHDFYSIMNNFYSTTTTYLILFWPKSTQIIVDFVFVVFVFVFIVSDFVFVVNHFMLTLFDSMYNLYLQIPYYLLKKYGFESRI